MPTIPYDPNIPQAGDNPSSSQGQMLTNFNSINEIINVDHFSFNTGPSSKDGIHRQVTLPRKTGPTGSNNFGIEYANVATSVGAGEETNLFYTSDSTGKQYQLTRTISSAFNTFFGQNTLYVTPGPPTLKGGWTFLPGGLIKIYGFIGGNFGLGRQGTTDLTVTYPGGITFTNNPYYLNVFWYSPVNFAVTPPVPIFSRSVTTTQFVLNTLSPYTNISPAGLFFEVLGN